MFSLRINGKEILSVLFVKHDTIIISYPIAVNEWSTSVRMKIQS